MNSIVDYWVRYHATKAVVAAALVAVFVALGVLLGRMALRPGVLSAWKRNVATAAGGVVAALALFSAALVIANVQGALAPFSSLLSLLPAGSADDDLRTAVAQIRQDLVGYPSQPATPHRQFRMPHYSPTKACLTLSSGSDTPGSMKRFRLVSRCHIDFGRVWSCSCCR